MIDFTSVRRDIEGFLKDNFHMVPEVPILAENTDIDQKDLPESIELLDTNTDADIPSMDNDIGQVIRGILIITINTQKGIGTKRSRTIASELSKILVARGKGVVGFSGAGLYSVPENPDSLFYQQELHLPYSYVYGSSSEC